MKSAINPALDNLNEVLVKLEASIENSLKTPKKRKTEPQLDLSVRDERAVNRKIALKLDQTINRLETLLGGGE